MMRATPESPPMFANAFVDSFSRIPWFVVPIIYVPISVALAVYGVVGAGIGIVASLGWALLGGFAWTLAEYWLHRELFHWVPKTSWALASTSSCTASITTGWRIATAW